MATDNKPATGKVTPPNAGNGRTPGTPNKVTTRLKDAILLAAEQVGQDKKGKGGLTGYLRFLAVKEPKSFSTLLGKVLPMRITGPGPGGSLLVKNASDLTDEQLAAIATGAVKYDAVPENDDESHG